MKRYYGVSIAALTLAPLVVCPLFSQTEVSGDVSGVWTSSGSPYLVVDTVYVREGDALIIEPGVTVDFQGYYRFYIYGLLQAVGTETDSIYFTTDTVANPDKWGGLRFYDANDSCKLQYCKIEYGKAHGSCPHNRGGGIYLSHSNPMISNNAIINNSSVSGAAAWGGGGIYCDVSNPTIMNNTISNNYTGHDGGGIYCSWSSPLIQDNIIVENTASMRGAGIACFMYSNAIIADNVISNNTGNGGGGIYCSGSSAEIKNNIITDNVAHNGAGISCYLYGSGSTRIIGNLISGNSANMTGGAIYNEGSSPQITNNTITNNNASYGGGGIYNMSVYVGVMIYSNPPVINNILYYNFAGDGSQIYSATSCSTFVSYSDIQYKDSTGIYGGVNWGDGNIDAVPLFVDTLGGDYRLTEYSPCIDAGTPDTTGLFLPHGDLDGNLRIWDGDNDGVTIVDMGAYEYDAPPIGIGEFEEEMGGFRHILLKPNPSHGKIDIQYILIHRTVTVLELYDISGRKIERFHYGLEEAGHHEVPIDCSGLSGGIYFIRIKGDVFTAVEKFILLP